MGLIVGVFSDVVAICGYVLLIASVYKLFEIATELGEIKQLLKNQSRSVAPSPALAQALAPLTDMRSSDDASDYAEKLLRAVNAESRPLAPAAPPNLPIPSDPR